MSIKDFTKKIKPFFTDIRSRISGFKNKLEVKNDLFIVLIIIFVAFTSFGLGKLSGLEKQRTAIAVIKTQESIGATALENTSSAQTGSIGISSSTVPATNQEGIVFGSKSGTKYYYPWCSGANRIAEANRVWFKSIQDARFAGLTPAANCPGLQ